MKIAFVYPWFEKFLTNNPEIDTSLVDYFLGDFTTPPSLGIPLLNAITPPEVDRVLLDDNAGDIIDFDVEYDLIAINCFTPQATRAFEIADEFRKRGTQVVMGGFFPSFMEQECLKHCDAVSTGEGEAVWLEILEDAKNRSLKKIYRGGHKMKPEDIPEPDRSIFYGKTNYTWEEDIVQVTRGCVYKCAMCAIPEHMGHRMRFRPVADVVKEVANCKYENVYLADDTLFFEHKKTLEYTKELLTALIPLKKKYFVASTAALNTDPEMIKLMVEAGVVNYYCTMNVDPLSIKALQGDEKAQQQIIDLVETLESSGIRFFGSCAIGRDWDDENIADRVLDLFQRANIKTSEFFIFTPYPGSSHWDRMEKQGRIFDKTWKHYNGAHVVFEPAKMSADELYKQFVKIWNTFFERQKVTNTANMEPKTFKDETEIVGIPLQQSGVVGESAITGIGVLSPIGSSTDEILKSLKSEKSAIAPITRFDVSNFAINTAGEIKNFDSSKELTEDENSLFEDDYLKYAVFAAKKAIEDAGIKLEDINEDMAIVLATCNGGLLSGEKEYMWKHGKADTPYSEKLNLQAQYYGFGKALSYALGVKGEVWLATTACSSTTAAMGIAKTLIDKGYYKKVLVGGSDSYSYANQAGFDGLKSTSTEPIAPFSTPTGLNIGEASCFWVVEEMEQAILNNRRIYGKIAGHATTSDAYHPTSPDPKGDSSYRTMKLALEDSGLTLGEMGVINAHGTGTPANDKAEMKGISRLLKEADVSVPVVSTKSYFGHCMGSTGILEATCNLLAMNDGFIPPTINFKESRSETDLDFVPNKCREANYDAFVTANYAFGGNNAAAVITKWDKPMNYPKKTTEKVVITGTGVVSSAGLGVAPLLEALRNGESKIGSAESIIMGDLKSNRAGIVEGFSAREVNRRLDFSQKTKIVKMSTAASFYALEEAGVKINRRNAEDYGMALGMCNGPSEMNYMDGVYRGDTPNIDIACFSNITANSVAGWVSNILTLKGINITLSPGHHSGLQAIAYAYDSLTQNRAKAVVAGAADEVDPQTYFNYDLLGFLNRDEQEAEYKYRAENNLEKTLGEGAALLNLEPESIANDRDVNILGEVLGYGMSMDAAKFDEHSVDDSQLTRAIQTALSRSTTCQTEIDLVLWAPQGNSQDIKVINSCKAVFGDRKVAMLDTSYTTGYVEGTSTTMALAAALEAIKDGKGLWNSRTGITEIDEIETPKEVKNILVVGSSDVGYNFSLVVEVK
jgi:3-oxoacyl-[acyl-carrier-protein] synthase II